MLRSIAVSSLFVLLVSLLVVSARSQKESDWKRATLSKAGASVLLPGPAQKDDNSQNDKKTGARVLGESAQVQKKDQYFYLAIVMRFNDAARNDLARNTPKGTDPLAYFAEKTFAEQFKNPADGTQRSEAPLKVGGLSGKEITLIGDDKGMRLLSKIRLLNDKNTVVCLTGGQKGENINGGAINKFLNSVQLGPFPAELKGTVRSGKP